MAFGVWSSSILNHIFFLMNIEAFCVFVCVRCALPCFAVCFFVVLCWVKIELVSVSVLVGVLWTSHKNNNMYMNYDDGDDEKEKKKKKKLKMMTMTIYI